jgi:hypothetical protein
MKILRFISAVTVLTTCASGLFAEDKISSISKTKLKCSNLESVYPHKQPELPKLTKDRKWQEMPFESQNPEPQGDALERKKGFILFHRLLTTPVYPGSRPLEDEKMSKGLKLFMAKNEFETTSFTVYPLRGINDFKVWASELKDSSGRTIPTDAVDIRLVTCWKLRYPGYRSGTTWRKMPELLEKVTNNSFSAKDCQRYFISVKVPDNCQPGIYSGNIYLSDKDSAEATVLPLTVKVLNFKLLSPPGKNYSAFDYDISRMFRRVKASHPTPQRLKHWENCVKNYYQQKKNYGMDKITVIRLLYDKKGDCFKVEANGSPIDGMLAAGLKGPVAIMMLSANAQLLNSKYNINYQKIRRKKVIFPPEFYQDLTRLTQKMEVERKKKGWPEFIYCPFDEIKRQHLEIGVKSLQALKKAGVRTFTTKNPATSSLEYKRYSPYLDIWCSQPFAMVPAKAAKTKYGAWSYPNHIAGEIRKPETMTFGGRMTYGYGFWKSGYSKIMPWIWHDRCKRREPFDYMTRHFCPTGNVVSNDGKFYPAVYWVCFREGADDLRYIYTLMQTVYDKKNNKNSKCRKLCGEAESFIEKVWSRIPVEQKYLFKNSWTAQDYSSVKNYAAYLIEKLSKYSGKSERKISSTLNLKMADAFTEHKNYLTASFNSTNNAKGNLLLPDFKWKACNKECKLTRKDASMILDFNIDHKIDGETLGGKYPMGWPRARLDLANGKVNLADYDFIHLEISISSNRDEIQDDKTSLYFTLKTWDNNFTQMQLLGRVDENKVIKINIPVKKLIADLKPAVKNKKEIFLKIMQLVVSENKYLDKTKLKFKISRFALEKIGSATLLNVKHPVFISKNSKNIPVQLQTLGSKCKAEVLLQKSNSKEIAAKCEANISQNANILLKTKRLSPGDYNLIIKLNGKVVSTKIITVLPIIN